MSWVGAPIKLLHEAVGHTVTVELKSGHMYDIFNNIAKKKIDYKTLMIFVNFVNKMQI